MFKFKTPQFLASATKLLELQRNAKLSRGALEASQLKKFRRIATYASRHSQYYATIIQERNIDLSTCIPADFPILTKSLVMDNFDRIVTDRRLTKQGIEQFLTHSTDPNELHLGEYQVVHTSGSSGEMGYFVFNQKEWGYGLASGARLRAKPRPFRRQKIAFFGATGGHFTGVSAACTGLRGINRLFFNVITCEINRPLAETVAELNAFQPELLAGYTAALGMLAERQQAGALRIAPESIEATGEPVTEADRALLEASFNCEVFNMYGCSEHLVTGIGAPGDSGMMLYDDDVIYDLHHDHSIVTNLFNYTLPLICYRMSDTLTPISTTSSTSPYRMMESLVGRVEITPKFINVDGVEDLVSPHTINEIHVPGVRRFQMRLIDNSAFDFLVVVDGDLNAQQVANAVAGVKTRLAEIFRGKRMDNVRFEVNVVDNVPVDPKTRKFRLIVPGPITANIGSQIQAAERHI